MTVRELIKENPWKALIGSISIGTIIFTLVGSVFSELRYVSRSEFEQHKVENSVVIRELQKQVIILSEEKNKVK